MNSRILLCAGLLALLSACGGGGGESPANAVANTALPTGATSLMLAGDSAGSFGEVFMDSNGNGVMLVGTGDAGPAAAYYDIRARFLRRVPAPDGAMQLAVESGSTQAVRTTALTLSSLAGSYTSIDKDNAVAGFSIGANGAIAPAASGCKVSGTVSGASDISGVLPLSIALSDCGSKDGSYQGYLIGAAEYAPAAFRIVAENRTSFVDMLAFK